MKTLDEVIETAPYGGTEWTNDALHYLKEYRKQWRYMVKLIRLLRNITWDFDYNDHPLIYGNDVESSLWAASADDVWRKE